MPEAGRRADRRDSGKAAADALYADAFVWDAHAGFESWPTTDLRNLAVWKDAGVDFLSVNVGYDVQRWTDTIRVLAAFRRWFEASDDYALAGTVAEVRAARAAGRMAVAFDLEGMNALDGSLDLLYLVHALGVRQILFAYNRNSIAGGGCHDDDTGLTDFGAGGGPGDERARDPRRLLALRLPHHHGGDGALVRAGHLLALQSARAPRPRSEHPGRAGARVRGDRRGSRRQRDWPLPRRGRHAHATLADHVEYLLDLVGPDHVGIGLDYFFEADVDTSFQEALAGNEDYWPREQYPGGAIRCAAPSQLSELAAELLRRGRCEADVRAVLRGNFLRVAEQVWG